MKKTLMFLEHPNMFSISYGNSSIYVEGTRIIETEGDPEDIMLIKAHWMPRPLIRKPQPTPEVVRENEESLEFKISGNGVNFVYARHGRDLMG